MGKLPQILPKKIYDELIYRLVVTKNICENGKMFFQKRDNHATFGVKMQVSLYPFWRNRGQLVQQGRLQLLVLLLFLFARCRRYQAAMWQADSHLLGSITQQQLSS